MMYLKGHETAVSEMVVTGAPLRKGVDFRNSREQHSLIAYPITFLQLLGLPHRRYSALSAWQVE
jgi:hypothetical protein